MILFMNLAIQFFCDDLWFFSVRITKTDGSTHGCKGKIWVSLYCLFNEQLVNSDSTR